MRNFMLCGLTLLFCSSTLSQSYATSDIRVLLDNGIATVNIIFSTKHRGFVDGILKFDATSGLEWQLEALESRLYVDNENIGQSITFQPIGSLINWRGQKYRGAIQFVAVGEKIRVINRLDLEQYLRGVVPAEMQGNWPLEALKAQAVASRSYALARLKKNGEIEVTLTDNTVAQKHADELLFTCMTSYWSHNGLKPYMRYSVAGGEGGVMENVRVLGTPNLKKHWTDCLLYTSPRPRDRG